MKVVLLSDIHANLTALEAVLREAPTDAALWVMGDTAGYGPDPSDVLALLRERGAALVAGNHDLAVAGLLGLQDFNRDAADAVRLHRAWLAAEERDFLSSLPRTLAREAFTLVHGSLRDPVWEYILDADGALECFARAETAHCCNGHTHLPAVFRLLDGDRLELRAPRHGETVALAGGRALANPGSVGQPRDGDPRASWAVLDLEAATITFRRTRYDVKETQRRMRRRGLPSFLADRLAHGF